MMRRALAMVPLLVLMQSTRPDNYFACTTFPDSGLHLVFVVHYAPVSAGSQQVLLIVSDQQSYPCTNYQLESGTSVVGQSIQVSMSGRVLKPDVCLTATGPAQYHTALPIAPGTYDLDFARNGSLDRYQLTVTASAISITTIESSFTRPAP